MNINIRNLKNGAKLPHQLALLEGDISSAESTDTGKCKGQLYVSNECPLSYCCNHANKESSHVWPVRKGRFKAIVLLHQGWNEISLKFEQCNLCVTLFFEPQETDGHFVRPLYLICNDDEYEGHFQGPGDPSQHTAKVALEKIDLGIRLIQLFVAESMHRHGLSRRSFRLPIKGGQPVCRVFRLTTVTTGQASALSQQELWNLVKDELAMDPALTETEKTRSKYIAFISFTRFANPDKLVLQTHDERLALTKAHCALGGGGLGLLSTGCLHTWAGRLSELVARFTDCNEIDGTELLDDSRNRKTYWGCYAATLGAACHELGHTLDLCHSERGLMGADFGEIHKAFILPALMKESENSVADLGSEVDSENDNEPDTTSKNVEDLISNGVSGSSLISKLNLKKHLGNDWEAADFRREEALWIRYHKWFNPSHPNNSGRAPELHGKQFRAHHSLRIIILASCRNQGMLTRRYHEFPDRRRQLTFQRDEMNSWKPTKDDTTLRIMAEDCYGNTLISVTSYVEFMEKIAQINAES